MTRLANFADGFTSENEGDLETLATEQTLFALGELVNELKSIVSTHAKQDELISAIETIQINGVATEDTLGALLLLMSEIQGDMATGARQDLITAELESIDAAIKAVMTPTYEEILDLTTSAQTITAPANAKWCKIQADDTNSGTLRVKIGGAATVSSGMQFQPGRSEDYSAAGDISVIAESGTGNKIYVQFGV
jgi:hypothetical protein